LDVSSPFPPESGLTESGQKLLDISTIILAVNGPHPPIL
jgi:hypothetical protein